jgi:hypothetical protein
MFRSGLQQSGTQRYTLVNRRRERLRSTVIFDLYFAMAFSTSSAVRGRS